MQGVYDWSGGRGGGGEGEGLGLGKGDFVGAGVEA